MYKINRELSEIFSEMAAFYRFKGGEHRFRVTAYEKASRVIEHLAEDIRHYLKDDELVQLPGIGESIAAKIREYVKTGKIQKYEQLKKEEPGDFVALLEVKGLGPQTLKTLRDELGITTREELIEALNDGRVEGLEGFREKSVQNMLEGIRQMEKAEQRILLSEAQEISERLIGMLKSRPGVTKTEVAGSIRRGRETIGDIDILVSATPEHRSELVNYFTSLDDVRDVRSRGTTKASIIIEQHHRQVDLRIISDEQWGAALVYFTGSKEHNIHLRKIAKENGLKINEYGVYTIDTKRRVAGKTEKEIYRKLGLKWIPPEMRENSGEIELAAKQKMPVLVSREDVVGDFHVHSDWSDGVNDIEELARYVDGQTEYEYIILTDHSPSSRIAGGLDPGEFLKQFEAIERANRHLDRPLVKRGVEVDILADGSLDLHDTLLERMEWVTASVHSHFTRDNTDRLLAACDHPLVNAIGHPSGRLIGRREGYPVEMETVIQRAAETGTALEINAQPQRMDLDGTWARKAVESGVMLVIGTDAHDLAGLDYMNQGITIARRGWCRRNEVLNTKKWEEVAAFVRAKRDPVAIA